MVVIRSEGKFNDNTYLLDGNLYKLIGALSLFVIENNDIRMLVDTSSELASRVVAKKLKDSNLLPIHKVFLTHSHWDHVQAVHKLKTRIGEFEVLASENAIENLNHPENTNEGFGYDVKPITNLTPLKEGDIIDLNGLELEIINLFGHTMDSIAIYDSKNDNIFVGDALCDRNDEWTYVPPLIIPDFHEDEMLKTFQKLREMKSKLNSICLAHYGVWKGEHKDIIIDEMEDLYFKTKDTTIQWCKQNLSLEEITKKYHEMFTPNSKFHTRDNIHGLQLQLEWFTEGLKLYGFID